MGFAFAELNWSPDRFWCSTLREICAAYAHLLPAINTFEPFDDDEQVVLTEIKKKMERDKKLKNGN